MKYKILHLCKDKILYFYLGNKDLILHINILIKFNFKNRDLHLPKISSHSFSQRDSLSRSFFFV